jgi:hypothetical protein
MYQCNQTLLMYIGEKISKCNIRRHVGNTRLRGYKPVTGYKGGLK